MGTWVFRIISRGFSPDKWVVVPYYGQKKSKVRFLSHVWEKAGRVGFEPTICGSAGRRLGPGSTTGPRRRIHDSPYNGYNGEPNLVRVISPLLAGNNFICRNEYGLVRTCSLARSVRSESFK